MATLKAFRDLSEYLHVVPSDALILVESLLERYETDFRLKESISKPEIEALRALVSAAKKAPPEITGNSSKPRLLPQSAEDSPSQLRVAAEIRGQRALVAARRGTYRTAVQFGDRKMPWIVLPSPDMSTTDAEALVRTKLEERLGPNFELCWLDWDKTPSDPTDLIHQDPAPIWARCYVDSLKGISDPSYFLVMARQAYTHRRLDAFFVQNKSIHRLGMLRRPGGTRELIQALAKYPKTARLSHTQLRSVLFSLRTQQEVHLYRDTQQIRIEKVELERNELIANFKNQTRLALDELIQQASKEMVINSSKSMHIALLGDWSQTYPFASLERCLSVVHGRTITAQTLNPIDPWEGVEKALSSNESPTEFGPPSLRL